jgi:hypothetical protein
VIWLPQQPVLIDLGAVGSIALDPVWLEESLEDAACAAGYKDWPASDVARSVTDFLATDDPESPSPLQTFVSKVHGVLRAIGYPDLVPFFLRDGIELRVSLLDLANEEPSGFELGFFKACERACSQLVKGDIASKIAFEEMKPAVKAILRKRHWCPLCEAFAGDLIGFLRSVLCKLGNDRRITFAIR